MLRLLLPLLLALGLAACDSAPDAPGAPAPDDSFSLTVTVRDAAGQPVADQDLALVYNLAEPVRLPHAPAASTGGAFLSVPFPNPWQVLTRVHVYLPDTVATARLELFDVAGAVVRTLALPTEAGLHSVTLEGEPDGEAPLPGGVYRLRATLGSETVEQWTIRSAVYADGRSTWGRRLGRTGADGTLRVSDPTVAPGLFDVPSLPVTDENGNSLGELAVTRVATVVVVSDDGGLSGDPGARITLADGPNAVTLRR